MSKSKAIGTRGETTLVRFFESYGFKARRKALTGSKDEGDVELYWAPRLSEPVCFEVKSGKQTANPSRAQLEEWLKQARVEAENSGQRCMLVVLRYRRRTKDADVYLQYEGDWGPVREHLFLDELAEEYK